MYKVLRHGQLSGASNAETDAHYWTSTILLVHVGVGQPIQGLDGLPQGATPQSCEPRHSLVYVGK